MSVLVSELIPHYKVLEVTTPVLLTEMDGLQRSPKMWRFSLALALSIGTSVAAPFELLSREGEFPLQEVVWAYPLGHPRFDDQKVGRILKFDPTDVKMWGEPNADGTFLSFHVVVAGILHDRYKFGGSPFALVDGKVHRSGQFSFHPQTKGLGEYVASPGEHFMAFGFRHREAAEVFVSAVKSTINPDGEQGVAPNP